MELYINRLLDEWIQHSKIIIGVDYDDTIRNWKLDDYKIHSRVINLIRAAKQTGAYIVVFTACAPDRYAEIREYTKTMGVEIDSINENPIKLPYGNERKIYANIFLDDRAGLTEALDILEFTLYKYRGYLQSKKDLPDVA